MGKLGYVFKNKCDRCSIIYESDILTANDEAQLVELQNVPGSWAYIIVKDPAKESIQPLTNGPETRMSMVICEQCYEAFLKWFESAGLMEAKASIHVPENRIR